MKKISTKIVMLTMGTVILNEACIQLSTNTNLQINLNGNSNSSLDLNAMNKNSVRMNSNLPMNHSETNNDPNAAAAPYDLQFLDTMTNYHQGGIEMSKIVLTKSKTEKLKKFAQKIIDDQTKEIAQMKDLREKWFLEKPSALNLEMPGLVDSMKMMSGDQLKKMEMAEGKDFDAIFLDMMISHPQDAITMSKEALIKAEHAKSKR